MRGHCAIDLDLALNLSDAVDIKPKLLEEILCCLGSEFGRGPEDLYYVLVLNENLDSGPR